MNTIVKHEFENHAIGQRAEDGYVNLTQLCAAGGKLIADYFRQDSTKEYLSALSADMGIPMIVDRAKVPALVNRTKQGTWAHPEVAIDCAQWVSIPLRIWANRTLVKIITAQTVESTQGDIEQRLREVETQLEQLKIQALPPVVPELTRSMMVRQLINHYTKRMGCEHRPCYHLLYERFGMLYHWAPDPNSKLTKLAQVEATGKIEELYQLALKLFL